MVPSKVIEGIIAQSLKRKYRNKINFPDGIGIDYKKKNCKCTIDDTNTCKNNDPLAISYNFVVEQRAIQLQYIRESFFFFSSTNIRFIIC